MRVILVGNGRFGSLYRERIKQNARMELVGLVDSDANKLTKDAPVHATKLRHLLDNMDCDAVVIATTPEHHRELAAEALLAGKHVMCAKPGCLSLAEAKYVHSVADSVKRKFFVDYTMLSAPEVNAIDQQIGCFGSPNQFHSRRIVVTPPRPEGIVWDLLCHDVAAFFYLMDYWRITSVQCVIKEDAVVAFLYEDYAKVAQLEAEYSARSPARSISIRVEPRAQLAVRQVEIAWDQLQRLLLIQPDTGSAVFRYQDFPDPITLALTRFHREASSGYSNRAHFKMHSYVMSILHDLQASASADGEKKSVSL